MGTVEYLKAFQNTNSDTNFEKQAFGIIRAEGLNAYALGMYHALRQTVQIENTPELKNAYLLNFSCSLNALGTTFSPQGWSTYQNESLIPLFKNIQKYGHDFLNLNEETQELPNILFPAALVLRDMTKERTPDNFYAALTGQDVYNLAQEIKALWKQEPHYFDHPSISEEARFVYFADLLLILTNTGKELQANFEHSKKTNQAFIMGNQGKTASLLLDQIQYAAPNGAYSAIEQSLIIQSDLIRCYKDNAESENCAEFQPLTVV